LYGLAPPSPPPFSPVSKLFLFLSLPVHRRSSFLTECRSQTIRRRESLVLFKTIQYFEPKGAHNDSKNEIFLPQADLRKRFRNYWIIVVPFCTNTIGDCTHPPHSVSSSLLSLLHMWGCWSAHNRHLLVTPLPSALFVHRLIHSDFRILAGTGKVSSSSI
jgi:hypothetical protein